MVKELTEIFAPSGCEARMREYIEKRLSGLGGELKCDNTGNLIFHKSGKGARVCIECGTDSRGVMAVSTEDGKVCFAGVGGIGAAYLSGKKVEFENGKIGICRYDGENINSAKISDLYIETDGTAAEVGEFGAPLAEYFETENKVFANGLGDRIGLAAVLEALADMSADCDLYVLFSTQKRLGARGIRAYLPTEEFDFIVSADAVKCEKGVKSGDGCVIVAKDKGAVSDPRLCEKLSTAALLRGAKIKTAVTDENLYLGNILNSGAAPCAVIGIPVTNRGGSMEGAAKDDLKSAAEVLRAFVSEVSK